MTKPSSFALRAALLVLMAAGCAGSGASSGGMVSGAGGSSGGGAAPGAGGSSAGYGGSTGAGTGGSSGGNCLTDACVPALATSTSWAVQVDPPSSSPYAPTQISSRDVSKDASFMTVAATSVTVTVAPPSGGGSVPATANVLLTMPPQIPGRPDAVYQSAAVASGGTTVATLVVPPGALGAPGSLSVIPLPPADQQAPVYPFSVQVSSMIAVTLPEGDLLVSGQLLDSLQNSPPPTFVARTFQNGAQVSSAPLLQPDGTFVLRLPATAAANLLTLELRPTSSDPWVTSAPFMVAAGTKLGTISLPAYVKADSFSVAVTNGTTPLPGVSVRAQTSLGATAGSGTVSGTAQYAVSGTTDTSGNVTLQLLPGSTYAIAATPPPGSLYASECVPMVRTVSGGTSNGAPAPNVKTIVAAFRPVLSGTIRTAANTPVPNVSVSAIGTPDPYPPCAAPATMTASTTTDTGGRFQLPLDPGTYQLDYDPPAGSAAPRLTEESVTVSQGGTVAHDVTLPQGALVAGTVIGSKGEALSSAVVRFFQVRCTGTSDCQGTKRVAPLLIGKALTDTLGRYRMVVPAPPAP
ncbi:MAG TPA: carboxypeptidase regulatory-like domain-containing protein [Polyangia bacterium]|nr:carboxypeptidase regulatory-like domain-containing protein [Polyangia bacterium]